MKKNILLVAILATSLSFGQNTFPASGNVGIGTATPQTGLQLGELTSEVSLKQISIPGVYNFETLKLGQLGNGNSALEMVNHNSLNSSYGIRLMTNVDNGGPGLQFQYATSKNSYATLDYQTALFMSLNGNLGIGTLNPQTKLDVNGAIQTYNKDNNGASWDNVRIWAEGESSFIEANGDEKGLIIRSNTGNKILLMSNVGIGTMTPQEKLSVNGKIRAQEIKVEASNWPDYVFEEEYNVGTLEGLESYIKTNKRLPDMPSAKEVEKNGVELGEMNAKLLQKIEELTLHLIRENKENIKNQERLKAQEQQMKLLIKRIDQLGKKK